MKKITYICLLITSISILATACGENKEYEDLISEAKTAYSAQNYTRVVDLLNKIEDEEYLIEINDMLDMSKAHILLDEENYTGVIEKLNGKDSIEAKNMMNEAQYHLYLEEIKKLISSNNQDDIIKKIIEINGNLDDTKYIDIINEDILNEYKLILKELNYSDYESFDSLLEALDNTSLKGKDITEKFKDLKKNIEKNRVKAFLMSETWARLDGTNLMYTEIKVKFGEENIASVYNVDSKAKTEYGYKNGDVKWKNIKIIDNNSFSFKDLAKGKSDISYNNAKGTIDFDKKTIKIDVTSAEDWYENGDKQILVPSKIAEISKKAKPLIKEDFVLYYVDDENNRIKRKGKSLEDLIKDVGKPENGYISYQIIFEYLDKYKTKYDSEDDNSHSCTKRDIILGKSYIWNVLEKYGKAYVHDYKDYEFTEDESDSFKKSGAIYCLNYVYKKDDNEKYSLRFGFDSKLRFVHITCYNDDISKFYK